MGQISLSIPTNGLPRSTEEPKVGNDLTLIQNVINGNLDATNVSAALAQSAGVNQSGQVSKGVTVNAGPGTRTNVAYGALSDAADQVTGIVLPANGLIAVWYQATWQQSASHVARAAIFVGANQQVLANSSGAPVTVEAGTGGAISGLNQVLSSWHGGLASSDAAGAYTGDVTTGQAIGVAGQNPNTYINGVTTSLTVPQGGACYMFAAAGTYTVSVQFKASSGTVTASNRRLWVRAYSFA